MNCFDQGNWPALEEIERCRREQLQSPERIPAETSRGADRAPRPTLITLQRPEKAVVEVLWDESAAQSSAADCLDGHSAL